MVNAAWKGRETVVPHTKCAVARSSSYALILIVGLIASGCSAGSPHTIAISSTAPQESAEGDTPQSRAMDLGIDNPPEVQVIHEITPADSQRVYQSCLEDAGWSMAADGAFEVTKEQEGALNLAMYVCHEQYPVAEKYTRPLSSGQLGLLYDWWTDETVPCFMELGYDVGNVPSREFFLANPTWHPPSLIAEQAQPDVRAGIYESIDEVMYEVCPGPPDEALYPD